MVMASQPSPKALFLDADETLYTGHFHADFSSFLIEYAQNRNIDLNMIFDDLEAINQNYREAIMNDLPSPPNLTDKQKKLMQLAQDFFQAWSTPIEQLTDTHRNVLNMAPGFFEVHQMNGPNQLNHPDQIKSLVSTALENGHTVGVVSYTRFEFMLPFILKEIGLDQNAIKQVHTVGGFPRALENNPSQGQIINTVLTDNRVHTQFGKQLHMQKVLQSVNPEQAPNWENCLLLDDSNNNCRVLQSFGGQANVVPSARNGVADYDCYQYARQMFSTPAIEQAMGHEQQGPSAVDTQPSEPTNNLDAYSSRLNSYQQPGAYVPLPNLNEGDVRLQNRNPEHYSVTTPPINATANAADAMPGFGWERHYSPSPSDYFQPSEASTTPEVNPGGLNRDQLPGTEEESWADYKYNHPDTHHYAITTGQSNTQTVSPKAFDYENRFKPDPNIFAFTPTSPSDAQTHSAQAKASSTGPTFKERAKQIIEKLSSPKKYLSKFSLIKQIKKLAQKLQSQEQFTPESFNASPADATSQTATVAPLGQGSTQAPPAPQTDGATPDANDLLARMNQLNQTFEELDPSPEPQRRKAAQSLFDDLNKPSPPAEIAPASVEAQPNANDINMADNVQLHTQLKQLIAEGQKIVDESREHENRFGPTGMNLSFRGPEGQRQEHRQEKRELLVNVIMKLVELDQHLASSNFSKDDYLDYQGQLSQFLVENDKIDQNAFSHLDDAGREVLQTFKKDNHPAKDLIENAQKVLSEQMGPRFESPEESSALKAKRHD